MGKTRHFALQLHIVAPPVGVGARLGRQQAVSVRMGRLRKDIARRTVLEKAAHA